MKAAKPNIGALATTGVNLALGVIQELDINYEVRRLIPFRDTSVEGECGSRVPENFQASQKKTGVEL